jgi:hypothetical protein
METLNIIMWFLTASLWFFTGYMIGKLIKKNREKPEVGGVEVPVIDVLRPGEVVYINNEYFYLETVTTDRRPVSGEQDIELVFRKLSYHERIRRGLKYLESKGE